MPGFYATIYYRTQETFLDVRCLLELPYRNLGHHLRDIHETFSLIFIRICRSFVDVKECCRILQGGPRYKSTLNKNDDLAVRAPFSLGTVS